jgi:hypothetical protein
MTRTSSPGCRASGRGSALLLTLIITTLISALGMGLITLSGTERAAAGNHQAGVQMLYAAEAIAERVMLDLVSYPRWTDILSGARPSSFVPTGAPPIAPWREPIDLPRMTAELQAETDTGSPWGFNTPAWRLFAAGSLSDLAGDPRRTPLSFVVAWVADDSEEVDNMPQVDSNGVLLVRSQAIGQGGLRRIVQIAVKQDPTVPAGVRILSWREVR